MPGKSVLTQTIVEGATATSSKIITLKNWASDSLKSGITWANTETNGAIKYVQSNDPLKSKHDDWYYSQEQKNAALNGNKESKTPASHKNHASPEPNKGVSVNDSTTYSQISNTQYYDRVAQSEVYSINTPTGKKDVHEGKLVHSVFNNYTLANYRGTPLQDAGSGAAYGEYNQIDFNEDTLINPTVNTIIDRTSAHLGYTYSYSDFALCKYHGKISNTYMLTLRRFPTPIEDDIIKPFVTKPDGEHQFYEIPDLARAITWMAEETGNKIEDILNLKYKYNYEEQTADVQTLSTQTKERRGLLGEMVDSSKWSQSLWATLNGVDAYQNQVKASQPDGFDPLLTTYPNHVFGPYNSIRKILQRQGGLEFENEFTLTFNYQMRSLGGANPKIMFMDLMSNLLTLTYSNAPFWGGAVRYVGGGQGNIGSPLGNAGLIAEGKFGDFLTSVGNDIQKIFGAALKEPKSLLNLGGNFMSNILGGSLLNMFNNPQGSQIAKALLTGDATGHWHLTVGNPLNPVAVIGNLALINAELNLKGPMGVQDFPEELELKVTLKPARPRDKAEIERMFNAGRGRFYVKPYKGYDVNNQVVNDPYKGERDRGSAKVSKLQNIAQQEQMRRFANG